MEIKNKSYDLLVDAYSFLGDKEHWENGYKEFAFYWSCDVWLTNDIAIFLDYDYNESEDLIRAYLSRHEEDCAYFPCTFDGFKSACEWFDKQRLVLAEKLL